VFGFPGAAFLPSDQRNFGLMDQRRALSWVNDHIGAFGGDPSKITIMGESVGAWSSRQLLTNPPETPQFRAAILQSPMPGTPSDTEEAWSSLALALNCSGIDHSSLDCVRKLPWEDIRQALTENSLVFTPVYDNKTNSLSYDKPQGNGHWAAHIPVLVGTNANEGTIFESIIPSAEQQLNNIFGNNSTAKREVLAAYQPGLSDRELQAAIMTDYNFTCPTSDFARVVSNAGLPTWRYFFNASFPNNQPIPGAKAWHISEIPIVFGTYDRNGATASQIQLSRDIQQVWGDFVRTPENGPGWARVGQSANIIRIFDDGDAVAGRNVNGQTVDTVCQYYGYH
jgi:carboxylesterase type B